MTLGQGRLRHEYNQLTPDCSADISSFATSHSSNECFPSLQITRLILGLNGGGRTHLCKKRIQQGQRVRPQRVRPVLRQSRRGQRGRLLAAPLLRLQPCTVDPFTGQRWL